jgi:hypothetical protein
MPRLLRAELDGTELAAKFDRIYEESLEIWKQPYMWHFTDHGEPHSVQVERNLDALTRPLQRKGSENRLTQDEIFVLLSAACLHDIGMQRIDDPEARQKHANYAYELILKSSARIGSEERRIVLSIDDWNARAAIASVARAHWTDYALALPRKDFINAANGEGRLKLLGLLLAMADLLDLSPIRARYFLTPLRLYDLPPESELHHKIHRHVYGIRILRPNRRVRRRLQFRVDWNGNEQSVEEMNDWVMQWFDSQWRQLKGPLLEESNDSILWAKPWRHVRFRSQVGDVPSLTSIELNILRAKRADQIRIDRANFAARFLQALETKEAVVFIVPSESDFDTYMSEWCQAHARLYKDCRVARICVEPQLPFDTGTIAADIMQQLDQVIPADADAATALEYVLTRNKSLSLLTILRTNKIDKTDERLNASLYKLLRTLVLRTDSSAARICLLICPQAMGPGNIEGAQTIRFDESTLPRDEVEQHLRTMGFRPNQITRICGTIDALGLRSSPSDLYIYIEEHYAGVWPY